MKVKIIRLSKKDAFWDDRKKIIGSVGEWEYSIDMHNGWTGGKFIPDVPIQYVTMSDGACHFAYVKTEQVK